MKLTIEIPGWATSKHLRLYAGPELVAYKYAGENVKVKTSRCDFCGDCCRDVGESWVYRDKNGECSKLKKISKTESICSLGLNRPFKCTFAHEGFECAEKFKEIIK